MSDYMNETHDPRLTSWVDAANDAESDFPVQNLPFGVFSVADETAPRAGVAIGDHILDVAACVREGLLNRSAATDSCAGASLNRLMSQDVASISALRKDLSQLLRRDSGAGKRASAIRERIVIPMSGARMRLPAEIGDYTDFYASIHHATNVGSMFRPDSPLLPNYKHLPIGYHGRASSIVPSGTGVIRPSGQTRSGDAELPSFGPTSMLDYESELGFFIGAGNPHGSSIPLADAENHIFGFCLVNDWSARDIQAWEYQPLGPFLAKNFATTVSPWVVTAEAMAPYRVEAAARAASDPPLLPYLVSDANSRRGGIGAVLEVFLSSAQMRREGVSPVRLSLSSFSTMYWTAAQMVAHHASNGCNLRPGDLLASGTVSGPDHGSRGCLLELTWRGTEPLSLPTGESRKFLLDGDEIIMKGHLNAEGRRRIGFGECRGIILPTNSQT